MFSRRSPENVFASVVVCDERILQTKSFCNRANARAFESSFGELRNCRIQDRASCLKRALLFGSLARTPPPLHGRFQLCALRHVHLANTIAGETPRASCTDGYRGDPLLLAATKLSGRTLSEYSSLASPKLYSTVLVASFNSGRTTSDGLTPKTASLSRNSSPSKNS